MMGWKTAFVCLFDLYWGLKSSTNCYATNMVFVKVTVSPFQVKSADDICKLWTLTPRDKKILHKKGIKWKEGPWGHDEAEVLDENIKNYCLERGYEDPSKGKYDW